MTDGSSEKKRFFVRQYWKVLALWGAIAVGVLLLLHFGVDKKFVAVLTITLGLLTQAFAGLGAVVSLVPVVGPLIVKVFALPFFWILNGMGYMVSAIAIKKGYTKELVRSRVLTVALLVGLLLGYILGHLLPIR